MQMWGTPTLANMLIARIDFTRLRCQHHLRMSLMGPSDVKIGLYLRTIHIPSACYGTRMVRGWYADSTRMVLGWYADDTRIGWYADSDGTRKGCYAEHMRMIRG